MARRERERDEHKPIVAYGGGLAVEERLLVLFPFLIGGDHDGEEDAEILEQQ